MSTNHQIYKDTIRRCWEGVTYVITNAMPIDDQI